MAHYAGLDSENNIIQVFVGKNEDDATPEGFANWEVYYESVNPEFASVKRTSYNTKNGKYYNQDENGVHVLASEADQSKAFRGNYAGNAHIYDSVNDIFIINQPYASWTLDVATASWVAPIEKPADSDTVDYIWSEDTYLNDNTQGWIVYTK